MSEAIAESTISKALIPRAPRVWLVNLFFGPGAAPTGVLLAGLADDLVRRGWIVEVLTGTAEYRADVSSAESQFAGKIHRFRCESTGTGLRGKFVTWFKFYWKVAWFILWRQLPDVVIVQTTPPFLHSLFAWRAWFSRKRPRLILWNQDTYPESLTATGLMRESAWTYRFLQFVARWSARRTDQAVVLDRAMAERLAGQGIRRITVIPNWDVPPPVAPSDVLPADLRTLADGYRYRIAYTGNLGRGHDLTPVWDFLRRHPTQSEFCLLFIGKGERTAELQEMVQREGWTCVKFWPYLPQAEFAALLHWADFGLVALEPACLGLMSPSKMHAWLAAGKPVIYVGPAGSNVSETLQAYQCGFCVDPGTPGSFDPVASQLQNESLVRQMQDQARTAYRDRHCPQVGLQSWWNVLSSS